MKRPLGVAVVASLLLAAAPARAQDEGRGWYGWQLILADAVAITALKVPVPSEAGPVTRGMGMTLLLMNGPVLHMANGNARSASWSLTRLPALLLGRLAGAAVGRLACSTVSCNRRGPEIGQWVGLAPVLGFDYWTAF